MEIDFGDNLFNEQDLDFVREKVEQNIAIIFGNEKFMQEDEELERYRRILVSTFSSEEVEKLFCKYENFLRKSIDSQNCLAYYIGLKKGMELKEVK